MLKMIESFDQVNMSQLLAVYAQSNIQQGFSCMPNGSQWERARTGEDAMRVYIIDFIKTSGTKLAVWVEDGAYVSVLRLEPYANGYLLTGLETMPDARCKGYATRLINAVLEIVPECIYSHVCKSNKVSLTVHQNAGFRILYDYGRLLDGTVSCSYYTLIAH